MRRGPHPQTSNSAASELPSWARLDEQFEDIRILALDPRRTTVSRVHESMRVVYLKLDRAPDRFWVRLFRENREQRTNPLRFGLWFEDEWISFDCRIDDIETSHVPDIEASIAYANRRYREVLEERRALRTEPVDEGPSEAAKLDALAARLRERFAGDAVPGHEPVPSPPASAALDALRRAVPTSRMQAPSEPLGDDAEREEWHRRLGLDTLVTTGSRISVFGPHGRGEEPAATPAPAPEPARTLLREVDLGSFEIEWSEPAPAPVPVVEPPPLATAPAPTPAPPDAPAPDSDDPTLEFERRRAALRMRLRAAAQSGGDDIPRGDE